MDDKKIEEVAKVYMIGEFYDRDEAEWNYPITNEEKRNQCIIDFKAGAKWAINEFLNDLNELIHPASEVPRNDNGKILAFSKVNSNIKLYDMNAMLNETACDTYQEMWELEVKAYRLDGWIYADELFDLIIKGGEQ